MSFYGFQIAKSGLYASQRGLEVVANNIANATTKGYSRQVLNLSSIPGAGGSLAGSASIAAVGAGVNIDNVDQYRDSYLDSQYRQQNSLSGEAQVKSDTLYSVEDLFNNTTDSGIDDILSTFFNSLDELTKSPESEEIRTLVRQDATSVVETMNYYSDQLESLQNQQNEAVSVTVGQINNLANEINDYNAQIIKYENNGSIANELRDKRNSALDDLSNIVNITYSEDSTGAVSVNFGSNNESLVDGSGVHLLSVAKDLPDYFGNADTFNSIYLSSGAAISADDLTSGTLKGYLDMRDGNSNSNMGIPYYINKLDNLTKGIIDSVNSVNKSGYTYPSDSNGNSSVTGVNFFDPLHVNAKTMSLDSQITNSVFNIAASSVQIIGETQTGNNENALALVGIIDKTDIPVISNIGQYLKSIVSDVAVQTSYSNGKVDSETLLLDNISTKRSSVSGVSVDEEMTNMMMYQKSYSAAARVITAIDEQLDTLINKTGTVGR